MSELEPKLKACLEPISAQAAAGHDARFDPQHELVRAEIAKLTALVAETPKWEQVEALGLNVLTTQSKDLLIASYLAYALSELHGYEGAERGLGLVADMLSTFGPTLFPLRTRARVNALEWLLTRFQERVPQLAPPSGEQVRALERKVTQLRAAALALCGEDTPSFSELLRALERMALSAPAAHSAPSGAAAPAPSSPAALAAAATAAAATGNGGQSAHPSVLSTPLSTRAAPAHAGSAIAPLRTAAANGAGSGSPVVTTLQPITGAQTAPRTASQTAGLAAGTARVAEAGSGSLTASAGNGSATLLGTASSPMANGAAGMRATHETPGSPPAHAVRARPPAGDGAVEELIHAFGVPPVEPAKVQGYVYRAGLVLIDLARSRFAADCCDPRAYRWLRTGVWLGWERAPAANRRGRTEIDPPAPKVRAELAQLVQAEQWQELLARSEATVADHPFWLDPHWLTRRALERLGEPFSAAQAAVEREARAASLRMPELLELQFADGTPLGSPEVVAWWRSLGGAGQGPRIGEVGPPNASALCAGVAQGERAAGEKFEKALRGSGSMRAAFQLRLELARALQAAGKSEQALYLCRALEQEIDAYRLEQWEPELAALALKTLWQLLSARAQGRADTETGRVGAKLAQLAPTSLL